MPSGFLLSSLPILPFLYITQHLYGPTTPPASIPGPTSYHGLELLSFCGHGIGPHHQQHQQGSDVSAERLFIKCTGTSAEQQPSSMMATTTTSTSALLARHQREGNRFLTPLTEEVGWSVILLDFSANSMMVATDAYASRPVYIATGAVPNCPSSHEGWSCPPGDHHYAVSSHRSALLRLGFRASSIAMVAPSTVQVYDMMPPSSSPPLLVETYSLNLQSFAKPPLPASPLGGGGATTTTPSGAESRFTMSLKRALGKILRHHPTSQASAPAATTTTAGGLTTVDMDRPRFHLFLHGDDSWCSNYDDPILQALASLPVPFVIYVATEGGAVLTRIWYERGAEGERVAMTVDLDINTLAQPILANTEPLTGLSDGGRQDEEEALAYALAAACHDASLRGSRLLVSSTNDLTPQAQPKPTPPPSQAMVRWLATERFIAEAAGMMDVVHPLLSPDVLHFYAHMGPESRAAVTKDACSGAVPSSPSLSSSQRPLPATTAGAAVDRLGDPAGVGQRTQQQDDSSQVARASSSAAMQQQQQRARRTSSSSSSPPPPPLPPASTSNSLPWNVSDHFMQLLPAYLSRERGDFDKAIGHLSRLLTKTPTEGSSSTTMRVANITGEMGVTYEIQGRIADAVRWYRRAVDTDPSYHEGYLLFARLFLGPESPFARASDEAKEETVQVLRQQVIADDDDEDDGGRRHRHSPPSTSPPPLAGGGSRQTHGPRAWHEQALYNLGSALYYTGRPEEADAAYAKIIRLPRKSDHDARRQQTPPPPPRHSSPHRKEDEVLRVIAVASRETEELGNLRASAKAAGVDLTVLGLGVEYTGHEVKLGLFMDFLDHQVQDDDQLIMAVDAYDVLLFPSLRHAPEMFRSSFRAPIVFGAERACWPDEGVSRIYQMANRTHPTLPSYLNSGAFMGRRGDLRHMVHRVMSYEARFASDQRLFTRYYLENPGEVELDHDSTLFYMVHSTTAPLVIDSQGSMHVPGKGTPAVVHANAGDGKHIYGPMAMAWHRALSTESTVLTLYTPYFRGIAHHGRGETALALVSFLIHTAIGKDYRAESCYNAAFLLHALGHRRIARLFYIRSMQLGPEVMDRALNNLIVLEVETGSSHARDALSAVYRAQTRRPRDPWLPPLTSALSEAMTTLFRTTVDPARLHAPADEDLMDAYDPPGDGGGGLAWVSKALMTGPLVEELTEILEVDLELSKVYVASPYVEAATLACGLLGWTGMKRGLTFGVERVRQVEAWMAAGQLHGLCASLFTKQEMVVVGGGSEMGGAGGERRQRQQVVVHDPTYDKIGDERYAAEHAGAGNSRQDAHHRRSDIDTKELEAMVFEEGSGGGGSDGKGRGARRLPFAMRRSF